MNRSIVTLLLCVISVAHDVTAQGPARVIRAAAFDTNKNDAADVIYLWLSAPFGTSQAVAEAERADNYAIVDTTDRRFLTVARAEVDDVDGGKEHSSVVAVYPAAELSRSQPARYRLFLQRLSLRDQLLEGRLVDLTFGSPSSTPQTVSRWLVEGAADRDEADVFVDGQVGRSAGQNLVGTVDLKAQIPFIRPQWFNRLHTVAPKVELQASSEATADANTARAEVFWSFHPLRKRAGPLSGIRLENSAGFEGEKDFNDLGVLWRSRVVLVSVAPRGGWGTWYLKPYVGWDLGEKTGNQETSGIRRTLIGGSLTMLLSSVPIAAEGIDLEFTAERRDIRSGERDAARVQPWFSSRALIQVNELFGFAVSFEHGRQPPAYRQVDKKLMLGLTYKAVFVRGRR